MIQVTAMSTATSEELFRHLAVPEAWGVWGRFPMRSRQARKGGTTAYGVGAVKKIGPVSEQTVVYEPYSHFAYKALSGLPVRHYRSDVHLEPRDSGTLIRWEAEMKPLIPGTAALTRPVLRMMIKSFTRWLPAHLEDCPPSCPARQAGDI